MNVVIRHTEYLLSRKDCVIVPDLGAFLAKSESAVLDIDNDVIEAPRRVFSFNSDLKHNDGALICSVARAECISLEAAQRKVRSGVDAIMSQIRLNGKVDFGSIGTIAEAPEGMLTYTPTPYDDISIATMWLRDLELSPLSESTDDNILTAPIKKSRYWTLEKIGRLAASIAILIGFCFVLSTPIKVDDVMLASLAPEIRPCTTADILPEKESVKRLDIVLPQSGDATVEVTAKPKAIDKVASNGQYFIIVASLSTYDEAKRFADLYGTNNLKVLEGSNYYRVYSAQASSIYEAIDAWHEAQKTHPNAWVFKKMTN